PATTPIDLQSGGEEVPQWLARELAEPEAADKRSGRESGRERGQQRRRWDADTAKDAHTLPAAGSRRGNDGREAGRIDRVRRDPHAAGDRQIVGEKAGELHPRHAVEYLHLRGAAGAGPCDDVGP